MSKVIKNRQTGPQSEWLPYGEIYLVAPVGTRATIGDIKTPSTRQTARPSLPSLRQTRLPSRRRITRGSVGTRNDRASGVDNAKNDSTSTCLYKRVAIVEAVEAVYTRNPTAKIVGTA